jgi:parvulin-like peptidyl-prolyl cis-trans isomerase-like protein
MSWLLALLREPLTHFAVIGAVLFGADHWLSSRAPDPRVVRLGDAQRVELVENFKHRLGREPSEAELMRLTDRWLEDEILYREGQTLGLASEDLLIKNRVVEKMRLLLSNAASAREPTDDELRAWLQERRSDYERPRRYDFEHVVVRGETAAEQSKAAQELLARLSEGLEPESLGGLYRVYEGRSAENVTAMFGREVEAQLAVLPTGGWHVVTQPGLEPGATGTRVQQASARASLESAERQLHLLRLSRVENPTPPDFSALRAELAADWQRNQQQQATLERLRDLKSRYQVERGGT